MKQIRQEKADKALKAREKIAASIEKARELHGYKQNELAQQTKISLHTIEQLERASSEFYKEESYAEGFLKIICKELQISADSLLALCKIASENRELSHTSSLKPSKHMIKKLKQFQSPIILAFTTILFIMALIYS